jgi:hypothetical protein
MIARFSQLGFQIRPRGQRGELGENEKWWADRQKVLEQAGYMLRPRYHPGRKFSWAGTDKSYLDFEDGQPLVVSVVIPSDEQFPQQLLVPSGYGCDPDLRWEICDAENASRG